MLLRLITDQKDDEEGEGRERKKSFCWAGRVVDESTRERERENSIRERGWGWVRESLIKKK